MSNKNNLQQLKIHQDAFEELRTELSTMDLNHPDFESKSKLAVIEEQKVNEIMKLIQIENQHINNLSRHMNNSEEHVIGEFIKPAKSFQL